MVFIAPSTTAPSATAIASALTVPEIRAVFVISTLPSAALDLARHNHVVGVNTALPKAVACQRDRAFDVAVARDFAVNDKIAIAGDFAADFAAFVNERCFAR